MQKAQKVQQVGFQNGIARLSTRHMYVHICITPGAFFTFFNDTKSRVKIIRCIVKRKDRAYKSGLTILNDDIKCEIQWKRIV